MNERHELPRPDGLSPERIEQIRQRLKDNAVGFNWRLVHDLMQHIDAQAATIAQLQQGVMAHQQEVMLRCEEIGELRLSLIGLVERYTELINSGDCGNWNPEDEHEVKAARAALAGHSPASEAERGEA